MDNLFEVITEELLDELKLVYYGGGKKLKVGDKVTKAYSINYANLDGKPTTLFTHEEAGHIHLNLYVLDEEKNTLFQLYGLR